MVLVHLTNYAESDINFVYNDNHILNVSESIISKLPLTCQKNIF